MPMGCIDVYVARAMNAPIVVIPQFGAGRPFQKSAYPEDDQGSRQFLPLVMLLIPITATLDLFADS